MAKSKLDKLKEAIESARLFLTGVVIGTEAGQYDQVDVDEFDSIVEKAELLVTDEGLEPSRYDEEIVALDEGLKFLQSKSVEPTPDPQQEKETGSIDVSLKGTASQRKGHHTIHFNHSIVTFQDGKASLPVELAEDLIKAGYAE